MNDHKHYFKQLVVLKNESTLVIFFTSLFLILVFNSFQTAIAVSPPFELQEIINENHSWVQTYGKSDANLKSDYTDILGVDYISNGKTINATFWLASAVKDSSILVLNQPFRKIAYGMLIDADSNTKTGYSGGDYDFYRVI